MANKGTGFAGPGKRLATTTPGPWTKWRGSLVGKYVRFIQTYCRPPKGYGAGKPMRVAPFQTDFLEAAFADGIDVAIMQTPLGNGKSTFWAGVGLAALYIGNDTGAPQVPVLATTITQAVRSVYGVAAAMVDAEPELVNRALVYTGITSPRINVPSNGGEMFPTTNDVGVVQGLDYTVAIIDEMGFQPQDSWNAMQLRQGKRARSLACGVGTPGLDSDNAMHYNRQLVLEGGGAPRGMVFTEYSAPLDADIDDEDVWRAANPAIDAGFLSIDAIRNARARTQEGPFRIYRLGQWWEGVDNWLGQNGAALWEALVSPYDFVSDAPTWLGVDVALTQDTAAVVAVQQRPDGRYHAQARIWTPTLDKAVDLADVMQHIRDCHEAYDVLAVAYDPRYFEYPAKLLEDGKVRMAKVPQSVERMTMACGGLYGAIVGAVDATGKLVPPTLTHDGDPLFTRQVLNGVARYNERGFTLAKGKSRGKIDSAIALALAMDRAQVVRPRKRAAVAMSF